MPAVSVIIPTHNRPELLKQAILSVLRQTFTDFEVIVIDDGDREAGTETVVSSFNDSRIRYIAQENPHSGAPSARNRGAKESSAELLAFLDDDDEWLPHKLERQVKGMKEASADIFFCFSSVIMSYDGKESLNCVEDGMGDFAERALRRFSGTMTSSIVVRRGAFLSVGGFDEAFPSHQEAEFMIRLAERYQGLGISEPLVRMGVSARRDHIGGDLSRRIRGREMLLNKHALRYASHPYLLAQHLLWLAFMYRDAGRIKEAVAAAQRAWVLHRRPSYLIRYLMLRFLRR